MYCQGCEYDEEMERQDDYVTDGAGVIVNKSAQYVCHGCGREHQWELGKPGLLPLFEDEDMATEPPEVPFNNPMFDL